jgi:polysaccharide transporter, PST family
MRRYQSSVMLAASTAVRMLLALYTVKVTAVTLGLVGSGIIGQFNNLMLIATMLAGGGIASGIVKTVAIQGRQLDEIRHDLSSAHGYGLVCTVLAVMGVTLGGEWLAPMLPVEHGVLLLIALAVSQYGMFQIAGLTAVLNSRNRQDLFAISNLAAGIVGAVMVTLGCLYFGLVGTLIGILAGALSQWAFLYALIRRHLPELASLGRPRLVVKDLRFWAHFSFLSLITVIGMPSVLVGLRNQLAEIAGWEVVGVWQAMVRLSDAYMQFGLLFLSAFYFPRLAASSSITDSKELVMRHMRIVLPVMVLLCGVIYMLRIDILFILFSNDFIGVADLFAPQLIGDTFRITSYLITYAFLATGHYKLSMVAELIQAVLFWFLANQYGLTHGAIGMTWSYAGTYMLYFTLIVLTYAFVILAEKNKKASLSPFTSTSRVTDIERDGNP